jgi:hypothetical protein
MGNDLAFVIDVGPRRMIGMLDAVFLEHVLGTVFAILVPLDDLHRVGVAHSDRDALADDADAFACVAARSVMEPRLHE